MALLPFRDYGHLLLLSTENNISLLVLRVSKVLAIFGISQIIE